MFLHHLLLPMVLDLTDIQVLTVLYFFTAECNIREYMKLMEPEKFASIFL